MSRKEPARKAKHAVNTQNKKEGNLGQKEARLEKEKTSELATMGKRSVQSEKSDWRTGINHIRTVWLRLIHDQAGIQCERSLQSA